MESTVGLVVSHVKLECAIAEHTMESPAYHCFPPSTLPNFTVCAFTGQPAGHLTSNEENVLLTHNTGNVSEHCRTVGVLSPMPAMPRVYMVMISSGMSARRQICNQKN